MTDTLQPRKAALSVLHRIRKGEEGDVALDGALTAAPMDRRDKAFSMALAMTCLRYSKAADALLAKVMQKPIDEKKAAYVADVLRLGTVQLLWMNVPSHAAVHSSVELIKHSKFIGFSKLVNGVLQRINREGDTLLQTLDVPRLATPDWLWKRWEKAYGSEGVQAIAAANLHEPKLDITVKDDAEGWAERLGGDVLAGNTIRLRETAIVNELDGFAEGAWWVQDVSATLPARMLGDLKGKQVLDLCAAPGGKTAQIVLAGGEVLAVDRSPKRIKRLNENLERLGMHVTVEAADVLQWEPTQQYDAILLDAPCTSTGTLRRHPDVAWRKSEKDVQELAELQAEMLKRAFGWLKSGGVLVYSTCSLEKEEGEAHIAPMLAAGAEISPVRADEIGGMAELITAEGYVRCLPHYLQDEGGMDGFFAARLVKK